MSQQSQPSVHIPNLLGKSLGAAQRAVGNKASVRIVPTTTAVLSEASMPNDDQANHQVSKHHQETRPGTNIAEGGVIGVVVIPPPAAVL